MTMNEMRAKKLLVELSSKMDTFYFQLNALQNNFKDGLIKENAAKRIYSKVMKSVEHYDNIQNAIQQKYPNSANTVMSLCKYSFNRFTEFFEG